MNKKFGIICLVCPLVIAGCTLYQKPDVPNLKTPNQFKYTLKYHNTKLKNQWWKNFDDPNLNQLVNCAIKNNNNYLIALKNIQIAQTYVMQNASALYPQVNLHYAVSENKNSGSSSTSTSNSVSGSNSISANKTPEFTSQQLFGSVSYEVDAWNQVRNSVKQAEANVSATIENSKIVKLLLISSVTTTYFQIAALNTTIRNLEEQYHSQNTILHLQKIQYQSGLINIEPVDDTKNQIEIIKSNIATLKKQQQLLKNTLSYLLGKYPENTAFIFHNYFLNKPLNQFVPPHLPSNMLMNRPDIQQSFFQVLSYGYIEKETLANFFPAFNLTGNLGYASSTLTAATSDLNLFWNIGANLSQYLLDFGLKKSLYENAKLQYKSSILNYKNTVLNAFKEVDNALASYQNDASALNAYQNQTRINKEKLAITDVRYQSGLADGIAYFTSKVAYLQSSYNLTNQQLLTAEDVVQIYQTLGLGLQDAPHRHSMPLHLPPPMG